MQIRAHSDEQRLRRAWTGTQRAPQKLVRRPALAQPVVAMQGKLTEQRALVIRIDAQCLVVQLGSRTLAGIGHFTVRLEVHIRQSDQRIGLHALSVLRQLDGRDIVARRVRQAP